MSDASKPICSRIEPSQFPLVIDAVGTVLAEVDSHKGRVFGADFWHWQYRDTPSGKTRVYGIFADGELKGYYHVPVYAGSILGQRGDLAMVQEVAISPELRGQGMFRKLADFVTQDLIRSGVAAAYTFPNRKSIHTFLKYNGYTQIATLPAYILPVRTGALIGSKVNLAGFEGPLGLAADRCFRAIGVPMDRAAVVSRHPRLTPQIVEVFEAYQHRHPVGLLRDRRYLSWRFEQRPGAHHYFFSLERDARLRAAAIFKLDEMLGNPALLLMDYAFYPGEEGALLQLIQKVKKEGQRATGRPFNFIFACAGSDFLPGLKKIGFLRVPSKLNPRPLDLLVRNLSASAQAIFDPCAWHVTLTDWDVM